MKELIEALKTSRCTVAMTGAGISTLCGIPDFRGPKGLYKQPGAERMFDIECFIKDPSLFYTGAKDFVYGFKKFHPGPVHRALKHLEDVGKLDGIITQNIDMLHQRAGSSNVLEVHGSLVHHHCIECGDEKSYDEICEMLTTMAVPRCKCGGVYKPDVTFFGEELPEDAMINAKRLSVRADVMLVLGSSLVVYPAAGLPQLTLQFGGRVFIVNASPTPLDPYAVARYTDLEEFADVVMQETSGW